MLLMQSESQMVYGFLGFYVILMENHWKDVSREINYLVYVYLCWLIFIYAENRLKSKSA